MTDITVEVIDESIADVIIENVDVIAVDVFDVGPAVIAVDIFEPGAGTIGPPGPPGAPGADGADGTDGADGVGVPAGGTTSQVLTKTSDTDYATAWTTPVPGAGIPAGGTTGQVLQKDSTFDFDVSWQDPASGTPPADSITNTELANMAGNTFKARLSTTGDPQDLTPAQAMTILPVFTDTLNGVAPLSGGGTANFLRADGTWSPPPGAVGSTGEIDGYSFHATQNETLTADPTNPVQGSPFFFTWTTVLNHSNPAAVTGMFGPRAAVQVEGRHQYNFGTSFGNFTAPSFGSFMRFRNQGSGAMTINPGWTYIAANQWQADGATVTMDRTDVGNFHAAFVDSSAYYTTDGGHLTGSTIAQCGFSSQPFYFGNTTLGKRIGFYVTDINTYPTDLYAAGLWTGLSNTFGDSGNTADATNISVAENIGIVVERMTKGTLNLAARFDGPVQLWTDTNTFTANPTSVMLVTGTHTFNYANANLSVFEMDSTFIFQQTASALGAISSINMHPTIKNHSSLSGAVFPLNVSMRIAPQFTADSQAVTATTIQNLSLAPTFSRTGSGSPAFTAATVEGIVAGITVNTGNTVTQYNGLHITAKTGSGALTSATGILIDALTATGDKYGIINLNPSILQGPIYGSIPTNGNLTLRTVGVADAGKGVIQLDNPTTELVVTDYTVDGSLTSFAFGQAALLLDATITMNASSQNTHRAFDHHPTIAFQQDGITGVNGVGAFVIHDTAIYTNSGTGNRNLGAIASYSSNPTVRANAPGVGNTVTAPFLVNFDGHMYLDKVTNGALAVTLYDNFVGHLNVASGVTVTERRGLDIRNPNVTGSPAGVITTNFGVWIEDQTSGATNWGIYNQATTLLAKTVTFGILGTFTTGVLLATASSTFTLSGGTPATNIFQGTKYAGTVTFTATPASAGAGQAFVDGMTYQNSGAIDINTITSYVSSPVVQVLGSQTPAAVYVGFDSTPVLQRAAVGVGTLTLATMTGFQTSGYVLAGVTVTARRGVFVANPNVVSGTITTNYGVYVDAQTGGTTNWGIYNLDTTLLAKTLTLGLDGTYAASQTLQTMSATYTYNSGTASNNAWSGTKYAGTVLFAGTGSSSAAGLAFADVTTYRSSGTFALGALFSFASTPIIQCDTSTVPAGTSFLGFQSSPIVQRQTVGSGTMTLSTATGFSSGGLYLAGITVTTLTGFLAAAPTITGTVTTYIGVDIAAVTAASTNIGIRLGEGMHINVGTSTGSYFGQTGSKIAFYGATPTAKQASANQAAVGTTAPAGGTGTAAGGWSTAGNRDTAITTINSLVTLCNEMRTVLVNLGLMKGSA